MDLDKVIRKLEVNESTISTIMGSLVLVVVGMLMFNYFKSSNGLGMANPSESVNENAGTIGDISATQVSKYTVTEGDTLWKIAEKEYNNGYAWVEIAKANNLSNPNVIEKGSELDIPNLDYDEKYLAKDTVEGEVAGASVTSEEPAITESEIEENQVSQSQSNSYTVQKGDYLWNIAESVYGDGYAWTRIWTANKDKIANPNILVSGTVLAIP